MTGTPLRRNPASAAAAPPRIVHLGLGAFHRAHQAWYTAHAADAADWTIAAFTGRAPRAADELSRQNGLYTLIERGPDRDRAEIVPTIAEAHPAGDVARLEELLAAPATALVTLTITEPAYRLRPDGTLDVTDAAVVADIAALRARAAPATPLGRLLSGLRARRSADAGPIAIVPCDNLPDNGARVRAALTGLARAVDPALEAWLREQTSVVSTSVDRITPRATDADRATAAALTGFYDASPVVAEPFADWVLCGRFPNGRPQWETAGARFVDDIGPWERRKLLLLNGAHSLLASQGLLRGHTTVAEAMSDPGIRAWVERYWDEAVRHLPAELDLDAYRRALAERFANARIAHHLAQIAEDGATKLALRVVPVLRAERAAGRGGDASLGAIAAWIRLVRTGAAARDAKQPAIERARRSADPVRALLAVLDPGIATDDVAAAVTAAEPATVGAA
ncbi:mannitol dehydrogenase family protein [Microbacterium azadirachtae]|uniref:Polyol:NADP oxidoreductase n=1 Tax=Microbacterium azadirachtae TaxID=582680 RepID=A0A0F0LTJ0_9MICO|nr:mannitol dehydrogenase family protein [Microbacterium azadirachtae]KJL34776.1 Polyol:NADP oxidoreductase [Microbacterium azadirachtae]